MWALASPLKNRKFFKRRHSWSTINFAVFSWYWPALFCALNTPKSALYRPDDPSQLLALVDFLLVFILYLSFSQKPHHLRDKKILKKKIFGISKNQNYNFEEVQNRDRDHFFCSKRQKKAERESLGGLPNTETSSQ